MTDSMSSRSGADDVLKTDEELRNELSPEEYRILREKGTEAAFTGKYHATKERGIYSCRVCGQDLFSSDAKFDSGTGWPSFTEPANLKHVALREDRSHGMVRTEVMCRRCGSHLGHVFDDLPKTYRSGRTGVPHEKDGKRYCINSACLVLNKDDGSNSAPDTRTP
ncbi:MAG: hypothetical protein RL681_272 [Candidatus Parcubacteria bacterium]|jgi:peptide-methionine (R)-S-oxide reductase